MAVDGQQPPDCYQAGDCLLSSTSTVVLGPPFQQECRMSRPGSACLRLEASLCTRRSHRAQYVPFRQGLARQDTDPRADAAALSGQTLE